MNGNPKGSGVTVEDPILIEDVYDFLTIKGHNKGSHAATYYAKMVNNIDFNDHPTYRYGFTSLKDIINGNRLILDGNNKEIKNLAFVNHNFQASGGAGLTLAGLHNAKFVNVTLISCKGDYGWLRVEGDEYSNSHSVNVMSPKDFPHCLPNKMNGGSFALKFRNTGTYIQSNWGNKPFTRCRIEIDSVSSTDNTVFGYSKFSFCSLEGTHKALGTGNENVYLFNNGYVSGTSVFVSVSAPNAQSLGVSMYFNSASWDSFNILDKKTTKISGTADGFKLLTTEQMKDVEYLQTLGFPVS